ncbi:MAG: hypothetical protein ACRDLL_09810 [Solirubrobacterales bacterium]
MTICSVVLPGMVAQASAAEFAPTPGLYNVNTSTLTLTGPSTSINGVDQGGIAVFSFDSVNIPTGVAIRVQGSRPFALAATGAFSLAGVIEASGAAAVQATPGPKEGGPGGGAGGTDGSQAGTGPGGGGHGLLTFDGGGGGGFGGAGAAGGTGTGGAGGTGGAAYGDLNAALQGGSGGAGGSISGSTVGGGGGGGAVELVASSLTITASGGVFANGGDGSGASFGASGGGSGGGILLRADTINVSGTLRAEGGDGGTGGGFGDGGGGGGGRIAYQARVLVNAGNAGVSGGVSGVRGTFGHGKLSPDPIGAAGVITKIQAPSAVTAPASSVSATGAQLNGTVNPLGDAATYRFEYGTTTSYGTSAPAPNGAVGADSVDHPLSLTLTKLKPNTTYHYRIVAAGQLGFTATGADISFKTKPFTGVAIGKKAQVKKGAAVIKLSSKTACKGKLKLSAKVSGKTIKLGSAKFSLREGKAKTVKVALNGSAVSLLQGGPLKVSATATASVSGVKKTTKRKLTLTVGSAKH